MSDYRINVRFHADVPAEKKAAEYLQTLNKSRNKFIVDAVIAYMNKESTDNETLLENIRQIFREEVQTVAIVSAPPTAVAATVELTEEQKAENAKNVLADLEMFGWAKIGDFGSKSIFTAFAVSKWLNAPNQEHGITVSFAPSRCKSRRMEGIRQRARVLHRNKQDICVPNVACRHKSYGGLFRGYP